MQLLYNIEINNRHCACPGCARWQAGEPPEGRSNLILGDCFVACGLLDPATLKQLKGMLDSTLWVAMTFLVVIPSAQASPAAGEVKKANAFYAKGEFDSALEHYQKALGKDPQSAAIEYNLGTALYKKGDYSQSIDHLQKALLTDDAGLQAKAQYNLGNAFYKAGIVQEDKNIKAAIESLERSLSHYEKVLNLPDKDVDTQYNDAFVKKELERLKQKQEEQKEQKQDQQQQKKDKQDQKQDQPSDQDQSSADKDKKDQPSSEDKKPSEDKKDQGENSNAQENKDQNGQEQKSDQGQEDKDKNKGKPQEAKDGQAEEPGEEQPSGGYSGESGSMTVKEAKMSLEDYQRNEEPKGMLYFAPQAGEDKPVGKDW